MPVVGTVVSPVRTHNKTIAFTGAAGLGAVGTVAIGTVTGRVFIHRITAYCTESLVSAGGGTLSLGVTGATTFFVASTTATDIDTGEWWFDNSPDAAAFDISASTGAFTSVIAADIIATVGTGDITDGTIVFEVVWEPVSVGGSIA